jgi:lipase maturation factor 1
MFQKLNSKNTSYSKITTLYFQGLGLLSFFHFFSWGTQFLGLSGSNGLLPLNIILFNSETKFSFIEKLIRTPTLFWISQKEEFMFMTLLLSLALSLCLIFKYQSKLSSFILWVIAVSIAAVTPEFSIFQSDNLMIETLFVSFLVCPRKNAAPMNYTIFIMSMLFFKVLFHSGLGKFLPPDTSWRALTFFDTYFQNIPHPTPIAYWFHRFRFKSIFIIGTFTTEIITPCFALTSNRSLRKVAFFGNVTLQIMILLSSNFATLNYNTLLLSLFLLQDSDIPWIQKPTVSTNSRQSIFITFFLYLFVLNSTVYTVGFFAKKDWPIMTHYLSLFTPFRSINRYVLFPETPPKFIQHEFEGSNDDGLTWKPYSYKLQPMTEDTAPRWFAPHNARFDTVIAYREDHPLVLFTAEQLLLNNTVIKQLFKTSPFDEAPDMIRVNQYEYTFTPLDSTAWWNKKKVENKVHFFYKNPLSNKIFYQEIYY